MTNNKQKLRLRVRALCEGAIIVAIAQILGYFKLFGEMVNGGSITFAAFPIVLFALRWGLGKGLIAGFAFGILQLVYDGAYAWGWQSMLLDYVVAYTPLGLAGLFKGKAWGIFPGAVLGNAVRFLVHFISGVTIYRIYEPTEILNVGVFDDAVLYSLVYNGLYMIPCMILTVAVAAVLYQPLKTYYAGSDLAKYYPAPVAE